MILKDLIPAVVLIIVALSSVLVLYTGFFRGSWKTVLTIIVLFSAVSAALLRFCGNQ